MPALTPAEFTVPLVDASLAVTPIARILFYESADWILPAAIVVLVVFGILWLIGKSRSSREQRERIKLAQQPADPHESAADHQQLTVPTEALLTDHAMPVTPPEVAPADSREAAWAELFDAQTSAVRLSEIATAYPEFAAQIDAHPSAYPELRQWIAAQQAAQTPGSANPADAFCDTATLSATTAIVPSEGLGPIERNNRRADALGFAAGSAALVLMIGGVALVDSLIGAPPQGNSSSPVAVAAGFDAVTFRDGLSEGWSVQGSALTTSDTNWLGHLPRMQAIHVPRTEQPLQIDGAVIMGTLPGGLDSELFMLDTQTGEVIWSESGRISCLPNESTRSARCAISDGTSTDVVTLDASGERERFSVDGDRWGMALQGDNIVLTGGGSVLSVDTSGQVIWESEDVAGVSFGLLQTSDSFVLAYNSQVWRLIDKTGRTVHQSDAAPAQTGAFDACGPMLTEEKLILVGTLCNSSTELAEINVEVKPDVDPLSIRQVSGDDGTWLFSQEGNVVSLDEVTGEPRWNAPGSVPGHAQEAQVVAGSAGDALILQSESGSIQLVSLASGELLASASADRGDEIVALPNAIAHFGVNSLTVRILDPDTLVELDARPWTPPPNYVEAIGGVNGVMVASVSCADCSVAEGSHVISGYTFYGPADDGSVVLPAASEIPSGIPECPAETKLLAWAELADGWVLVCGVDLDRPSYVAMQSSPGSTTLVSRGATDPLGAEALAAVIWDADLGRYIAQMQDDSELILDHTIGTATLRDASGSITSAQHRFVRYIFVLLDNVPLTAADAALASGAYGVQAPEETAEDQVRYLIQVLEKSYEGRALVKETLPILEKCSAEPGSYADTVTQMRAVYDNRAELLASLDATPVSLIPEGTQLLDDLRLAIDLSRRANVEYVAWAEATDRSGCTQLSAEGRQYADASDAPKERFAARWNRIVAPQFGVRTFDPWYI